jgi:hypothetical protein
MGARRAGPVVPLPADGGLLALLRARAPHPAAIVDAEGHVLAWNAAMARLPRWRDEVTRRARPGAASAEQVAAVLVIRTDLGRLRLLRVVTPFGAVGEPRRGGLALESLLPADAATRRRLEAAEPSCARRPPPGH